MTSYLHISAAEPRKPLKQSLPRCNTTRPSDFDNATDKQNTEGLQHLQSFEMGGRYVPESERLYGQDKRARRD